MSLVFLTREQLTVTSGAVVSLTASKITLHTIMAKLNVQVAPIRCCPAKTGANAPTTTSASLYNPAAELEVWGHDDMLNLGMIAPNVTATVDVEYYGDGGTQ